LLKKHHQSADHFKLLNFKMNEIDSYVATIDELVEDENKIVSV